VADSHRLSGARLFVAFEGGRAIRVAVERKLDGEKFSASDARAAAPTDHAVVEAIPDGVRLATRFAISLHDNSSSLDKLIIN